MIGYYHQIGERRLAAVTSGARRRESGGVDVVTEELPIGRRRRKLFWGTLGSERSLVPPERSISVAVCHLRQHDMTNYGGDGEKKPKIGVCLWMLMKIKGQNLSPLVFL